MPALQNFLKDEIARRRWPMDEFASRASLSLSNAYLIVRDGKDNVRRDTFEAIATALDMTPAELMVCIGKGAASDDPKRAPIYAQVRQVPDETLSLLERVVQTFVPPTDAKTHAKHRARIRRPDRSTASNTEDLPPEAPLESRYNGLRPALAFSVA